MHPANPDPEYYQASLFGPSPTTTHLVELFPGAWQAAEALTSLNLAEKQNGLELIRQSGAARVSPLVVYLLVSRLDEPDLILRAQVIQLLAGVLRSDDQGVPAPQAVRERLAGHLAQLKSSALISLLEAASVTQGLDKDIALLLTCCPAGGVMLGDIFSERKYPLDVRKKALHLVGEVGYLSALPALERLAARLESRAASQQTMPFVQLTAEDQRLLSEVYAVKDRLLAP